MRNLIHITILSLAVFLTCGCKFPDNVPQLDGITGLKFDNLKFGQTTIEDFKKLSPDAVGKEKGSSIIIFNTEPPSHHCEPASQANQSKNNDSDNLYKAIRVGFRDNKLDWVEFVFNGDVPLSKIVEIYGKPQDINSAYSKQMDYYDYDFFNISTNKKQTLAKCINLFGIKDSIQPQPKVTIIGGIPDITAISKKDFLGLKPGLTLEDEFTGNYPDLPVYKKDKFDGTSTYTLEKELGKAELSYKNVTIVFNNGLLSWINLIPQNLALDKALSMYGSNYKIETLDSRHDLYHYPNLVIVADKQNKKVISIGIIGSIGK